MPIRGKLRPLHEILDSTDSVEYKSTKSKRRQNFFVVFMKAKTEQYKAEKRLTFSYLGETLHNMSLYLVYQGRTDSIHYDVITGNVRHMVDHVDGLWDSTMYNYVCTEEEYFQRSLIEDTSLYCVQDFERIKALHLKYLPTVQGIYERHIESLQTERSC